MLVQFILLHGRLLVIDDSLIGILTPKAQWSFGRGHQCQKEAGVKSGEEMAARSSVLQRFWPVERQVGRDMSFIIIRFILDISSCMRTVLYFCLFSYALLSCSLRGAFVSARSRQGWDGLNKS